MICPHKLMFLSSLDLNGEAQNWRFLRASAEGSYASRQTHFLAAQSNLERLAQLRFGLREKVLASPLFDTPRFAANLEDALYEMKRRSSY